MSPHVSATQLYPSTTTPPSYAPTSCDGDWHPTHGDTDFRNIPTSSPRSHSQSTPRSEHLVSTTPTSFSFHRVDPSTLRSVKAGKKPAFIGTHSFDVLRSDPSTFSLEHIASSKTLQSRGPNATKLASPNGIANGSAPAFRVILPTAMSDSARTDNTITRLDTIDSRPNSFLGASTERQQSIINSFDPTSVVSFTFSDGSTVTKMTIDDEIRSRFREVGSRGATFRVEGRGKKHQCPQCPKRFNRPSSLRIHVNTHTGARPFQCPYPNCGREFNVNSNMRRHYRNHGMAATAEVHPPRHNSGRRPRGYPRPHPGHPSTTVFHISGGQSPRTTLSAASFTDDDFDMDQISDDGEDSTFDDQDEQDDADEEEAEEEEEEEEDCETRTTHCSLVPFTTSTEHGRNHSYLYPQSRAHTPSSSLARYSESSSSVPQRLGRIVYSPSSPVYMQSCKDTKVSTTLRPAFR